MYRLEKYFNNFVEAWLRKSKPIYSIMDLNMNINGTIKFKIDYDSDEYIFTLNKTGRDELSIMFKNCLKQVIPFGEFAKFTKSGILYKNGSEMSYFHIDGEKDMEFVIFDQYSENRLKITKRFDFLAG